MKNHLHAIFSFLLPLLTLAAIPARAYYDPGVQRWLNIDPDEDAGFRACLLEHSQGHGRLLGEPREPYIFGDNDPAGRLDPDGRTSTTFPIDIARPKVSTGVLGRLGLVGTLAYCVVEAVNI